MSSRLGAAAYRDSEHPSNAQPSTACQHKIGHFGDVFPANLLAQYGKTKSKTTKANMHP